LILVNFGLDTTFRKSEVICPSGHFVAILVRARVPDAVTSMDPGSAAHHHSASKTRVNALMVLRSVRGTPALIVGYTTTLSRFAARVMPV
jgi:hypothetical protein